VAAERSIFGAISSRWVYLFARTYTPRLSMEAYNFAISTSAQVPMLQQFDFD